MSESLSLELQGKRIWTIWRIARAEFEAGEERDRKVKPGTQQKELEFHSEVVAYMISELHTAGLGKQ